MTWFDILRRGAQLPTYCRGVVKLDLAPGKLPAVELHTYRGPEGTLGVWMTEDGDYLGSIDAFKC